jgi:hypothetical protein
MSNNQLWLRTYHNELVEEAMHARMLSRDAGEYQNIREYWIDEAIAAERSLESIQAGIGDPDCPSFADVLPVLKRGGAVRMVSWPVGHFIELLPPYTDRYRASWTTNGVSHPIFTEEDLAIWALQINEWEILSDTILGRDVA